MQSQKVSAIAAQEREATHNDVRARNTCCIGYSARCYNLVCYSGTAPPARNHVNRRRLWTVSFQRARVRFNVLGLPARAFPFLGFNVAVPSLGRRNWTKQMQVTRDSQRLMRVWLADFLAWALPLCEDLLLALQHDAGQMTRCSSETCANDI
jgi:hypothetical protein